MEAPLEETCVRAEPGCAICVQRFDDSLNSAIRTTYRISLRSSSLREPRYPSARVVFIRCELTSRLPPTRRPESTGRRDDDKGRTDAARRAPTDRRGQRRERARHLLKQTARATPRQRCPRDDAQPCAQPSQRAAHAKPRRAEGTSARRRPSRQRARRPPERHRSHECESGGKTGNDPSAGSPTETLLRLLLPLNDKVWTASRGIAAGEPAALPQSGGLTGSFNR